uniref:Uncharacterized protein n=1 Tax=Solanum lycopersicum TaxID=4081 RepID=A0A3Q7IQ64_SOLLC
MMGSRKNQSVGFSNSYDYSFKILLVGDSGVGKSSLLLTFISHHLFQDLSPTVGVDFKIRMLTVGSKRLKLTIWDTAGQERFGALTSSYYRGAHGIILVYDVTRRETFTNLSETWAKDIKSYSTNPECIKMLVGNKVDRDSERAVTREEGLAFAKEHNCLFLECSARTRENVQLCFKDLTLKVITINGKFPGPLLNATTNDNIHVNVFNDMDKYPVLITWNGIQQRHNSWQDGVSGTNCAIRPNTNWTYEFQLKDQIGSFFYFPTLHYEKAGGAFGPIQINNRVRIQPPFAEPEGDFDLLIGDWYENSFKVIGDKLAHEGYNKTPNMMLMNGKGSYLDPKAKSNESFTINQGKTYRLRISNVGSEWSFNFRIQNHTMLLVETEGSYTNQITLNSLDVHVGQSYSVLVTADQDAADYYIVATAKMANSTQLKTLQVVGVLHYENSTKPANGPIPNGPGPFDVNFSISQARSIRWNLTTGAARPNPQGTFNVSNVTLSQTFVLQNSLNYKNGMINYAINNVSYATPKTPLKLADYYLNGAGVYELDKFPANVSLPEVVYGTFVVSGEHKGWLEIVFKNELQVMDSWHLDGFSFFVVGYGFGNWKPESRSRYNLHDPIVRSTVQVYPKGWTAVYVYLDNPGMWNLRNCSDTSTSNTKSKARASTKPLASSEVFINTFTEEEEETAKCLVLLSKGRDDHPPPPRRFIDNNVDFFNEDLRLYPTKFNSKRYIETSTNSIDGQALGGHMRRHRGGANVNLPYHMSNLSPATSVDQEFGNNTINIMKKQRDHELSLDLNNIPIQDDHPVVSLKQQDQEQTQRQLVDCNY